MLQSLLDFRYAFRSLRRAPGFAAGAIATLALGIGANTAIFTVVNSVLLKPAGFREESRLHMVYTDAPRLGTHRGGASAANFGDWRDVNSTFESMSSFRVFSFQVISGDEPERIDGCRVSGGFFPTLGVAPALGRTIAQADDQPGAPRTAVLSHAYWTRRFAGSSGALGSAIDIDGQRYTIIGVMPASFRFFRETAQFWIPLAYSPEQAANRQQHNLSVIGRLKNGVSLTQAQADLSAIAARLTEQFPISNTGIGVAVVPLREDLTGRSKSILLILLATVGLLSLIGCSNAAALLLARSAARSRELAIRVSLGAGRLRLLMQFMTESLTLSILGGAAGLLLAQWASLAFPRILPAALYGAQSSRIDLTVLLFTLGAAILNAMIFGSAPALAGITRPDLAELRAGRGSIGGHRRVQSAIIGLQVALSILLVVGAALMIRTLWKLSAIDPGFDPGGVITARAFPARLDPVRSAARIEEIVSSVEAIPGVESAAYSSLLPMLVRAGAGGNFVIEGRARPRPGQEPFAGLRVVSRHYFRALRIPLMQGRVFEASDSAEAPVAGVMNQAMADRFWPGENVLGRRIRWWNLNPEKAPWISVVGVVGNTRESSLDQAPEPQFYLHHLQESRWPPRDLVVRAAAGDPLSIAAPVQAAIRTIDPQMAVSQVRTVDEVVAASVADRRLQMILLGSFAGLALLLAAVGIYGIVSYRVTRQTAEIGVRIALGASVWRIHATIFRQVMTPVAVGMLCGIAAAAGLSQLVAAQLYGVSPRDPLSFLAAPAILMLTAAAAALVPSLRAARIDPMAALRES